MDIIGVIIAGIIIGLLGKFFAPGNRDNIPLWLTIVCGIGGVLIGYYLAAALGVEATRGIDWIRWIISIVVAAILVMIAASVTGGDAAGRPKESRDREDQVLGADEAPAGRRATLPKASTRPARITESPRGLGPWWVRTASGTAGFRWARAVTTGTKKPQVTTSSRP